MSTLYVIRTAYFFSAISSSGNIRISFTREMPLRKCFPGAFFNLPLTSYFCFVILKNSFIFFRQARGGLYVIHKDAKI